MFCRYWWNPLIAAPFPHGFAPWFSSNLKAISPPKSRHKSERSTQHFAVTGGVKRCPRWGVLTLLAAGSLYYAVFDNEPVIGIDPLVVQQTNDGLFGLPHAYSLSTSFYSGERSYVDLGDFRIETRPDGSAMISEASKDTLILKLQPQSSSGLNLSFTLTDQDNLDDFRLCWRDQVERETECSEWHPWPKKQSVNAPAPLPDESIRRSALQTVPLQNAFPVAE